MDNYFDLYELPESFGPDQAKVRQRFYELSRRFHPDRFSRADETAQAEALQLSAQNNEAYKVLSHPDLLMAYILKLKGQLEEDEKYSLPPAFLMEMMDLNELVTDYEAAPDDVHLQQQAGQALEAQLQDWTTGIAPVLERISTEGMLPDLLAVVKDFYFRKKYLLRIKERLITFAAR